MMTSEDSPLLLPSCTPIVVTQAHFEDHKGAAHVPIRERQLEHVKNIKYQRIKMHLLKLKPTLTQLKWRIFD